MRNESQLICWSDTEMHFKGKRRNKHERGRELPKSKMQNVKQSFYRSPFFLLRQFKPLAHERCKCVRSKGDSCLGLLLFYLHFSPVADKLLSNNAAPGHKCFIEFAPCFWPCIVDNAGDIDVEFCFPSDFRCFHEEEQILGLTVWFSDILVV